MIQESEYSEVLRAFRRLYQLVEAAGQKHLFVHDPIVNPVYKAWKRQDESDRAYAEKARRRKELQKSACKKLTPEERDALNISELD